MTGLVDTAFASMATFAVGITAAGVLAPPDLGAYAVFFAAFVLVTVLPTNLVLLPVEIWLLDLPRDDRLHGVGRNLGLGLAASVISVLPLAAASLAVRDPVVTSSTLVALTLTSAAAGLVSPLQDHVRRLFHLADRGGLAAITSVVQFAAAITALVVLASSPIATAWVPLGALALANVVSLTTGLWLAGRSKLHVTTQRRPTMRQIFSSGRWLFAQGVIPLAAGFAAAALVAQLAGLVAMGRAEAARIVAQPLFVIGGGLNASLGPRSMEAGASRDHGRARAMRATYWRSLLPLAIVYAVVVAGDVPWNPMSHFVPTAYESVGLVAVSLLAGLLASTGFPMRSELLGLRQERALTWIDGLASLARVVVAAGASALAAFAIPVGAAVDGVVKTVGRWRKAESIMESPTESPGNGTP